MLTILEAAMTHTTTTIERDGMKMHIFLSKQVILRVACVVLEGERTMSFRGLKRRIKGSDNTHVVHVEDYGRGVVYTNVSAPDGSFTGLKGTLRLL